MDGIVYDQCELQTAVDDAKSARAQPAFQDDILGEVDVRGAQLRSRKREIYTSKMVKLSGGHST